MDHSDLHPRSQLARARWIDLSGPWGFPYDDADVGLDECWFEQSDPFQRTIMVPFPPESRASGIGDPGYHPVVWYRRTVQLAPAIAGFCYTQLADTEQESNGLTTADRTPKLDPAAVRAITRRPSQAIPGEILDHIQQVDEVTVLEGGG